MSYFNHLPAATPSRRFALYLACCLLLLACRPVGFAQTDAQAPADTPQGQTANDAAPQDQQPPSQAAGDVPAQPADAGAPQTTVGIVGTPISGPAPGKRQVREAEEAYLAGAKKLDHDDLSAAESDFQRALKLDPANRNYGIAISVTRQHRLTELVQQATKARLAGDERKAETLLAEAKSLDPENPVVLEHSGPFFVTQPIAPAAASSAQSSAAANDAGNASNAQLVDRTRLIALAQANELTHQPPDIAGAILLTPAPGTKSFHIHGASADVVRQVAAAYGINAVIDDSMERKDVRFDLEDVTYQKAMDVLMLMTHAFVVPVDTTGIIIARNDPANRTRLQRQMQETIYVPGFAPPQINELITMARNIFNVQKIETHLGTIVLVAPDAVIEPLNRTMQDLIDSTGEVMIEVKLYEIHTTHMTDIGGQLPTQFSVFNIDETATQIVNQNQALVQQAIAQGLVPAGTSNLQIALALIGAGLVKSSLASNLIGVIGSGALATGISASTNFTFNLGLNSTESRAIDDVQQRVADRQSATFREGTRYPIVTSTYTSGLSTAASALAGNATIGGVNVANLLQQYAGGSSATIPQVTYEDLGLTLKATPVVERSNNVSLALDLKVEALSGSSSDGNPILDSREFQSGITVGDGESVLMTSMVTRSEATALAGVPGLSELPGFQMPTQATVQKENDQLVVLVTPHVVRRPPQPMMGPVLPLRPEAIN